MKYVRLKDEEGLVRDQETNAILNVDRSSLARYKQRREKMEQKNQEIENLKSKMDNIENLLQQLLDRDNNK